MEYYVHNSSYIDDNVEIGEGTKVWHFSHILSGAKIGWDCIIGQNVCIERDVIIGNRCKVQNNVSVYKGVVLEDEVFCGPSCVFTNVYNPRAFIERKHEFRPTLVKRGATIGANATIVCGATVGRYALIAAGAVVKSDVADYAIVAGVPAKQVGWTCKCGTTLKANGEGLMAKGEGTTKSEANGEGLKAKGEGTMKSAANGQMLNANGEGLRAKGEGAMAKGEVTMVCSSCRNVYALRDGQFIIVREK